jgi:hypothetical protein
LAQKGAVVLFLFWVSGIWKIPDGKGVLLEMETFTCFSRGAFEARL